MAVSRKVDRAFARALALEPEERRHFLAGLAGTDRGVHDEVLRLLKLSDHARGLERIARETVARALRAGLERVTPDKP